jgi:hypothetical protein
MPIDLTSNPVYAFWLTVYAVSLTVLLIGLIGQRLFNMARRKRLSWDLQSEYIDIGEFSNRNIPVKVTYKGTEPRWLWATYLSLRNSGISDIVDADLPDKQHIVLGNEGCRYIGFNRLISDKARVTLTPLFRGSDVYCKIEFDRLGPGDEIICSLLFVADEKAEVKIEGNLYGANSQIVSGQRERLLSWRRLWWLLISVIVLGLIAAILFVQALVDQQAVLIGQLQALVILYLLALGTAGVFLRPIRYWHQVQERLQHNGPGGPGTSARRPRFIRAVRFMFGLTEEM